MNPGAVNDPLIHPTAIIHPSAIVDPTSQIGPYAVIGEEAVIGPRVRVGPHAIVEYATVEEGCQIYSGAFVGTAPQDLKYRGEKTRLFLGPGCIVRECATLNRGTAATGETRIGARCLFMAYAHVAHDCIIGSEVIVANSVAIAGHCEVGDWVVLGGMTGLHQFVRVGKLAMVGAGAMVPLDIPPFALAWGDRARLSGLNLIGLRRRGYSAESIADLKKVYRRIFFDSSVPLKTHLQNVLNEPTSPAVQEMVSFMAGSPRGICRPNSKSSDSEEK